MQTEAAPAARPRSIRNLYISASAYNVITLTDGALRAIVLLFLVGLNFSAITLAIMFSLYELMGIFVNFFGGILGSRFGMRFLVMGSTLAQLCCVVLLAPLEKVFPGLDQVAERNTTLIIFYITAAQMLSGMAKDLMKIQGKSVPKLVVSADDNDKLFKIIALVTGMKNSIKGFGYLFGSLLLFYVGWVGALCIQGGLLVPIVPLTLMYMESDLGVSQKKSNGIVRWDAFKKGWNVNVLSAARLFLFGSRDLWFEIAAPYFMRSVLMWAPFAVGGFMAGYTIIYGQLQVLTEKTFTKLLHRQPNARDVVVSAVINLIEVFALGLANYFAMLRFLETGDQTALVCVLLVGICLFAGLFAVNSAVHSFLIVRYSNHDKVAMDMGFYYMSNAGGRMVGTLLSGFIYTYTVDGYGISINLFVAAAFLLISATIAKWLRDEEKPSIRPQPEEDTVAEV